MDRKISLSTTSVVLVDRLWGTTSRYPKFLSKFRRLRHLTLDRGSGYLMATEEDLLEELKKLSPTLEDLTVIAEGITRLPLFEAFDAQKVRLDPKTSKRRELFNASEVRHFFPALQRLNVASCPLLFPPRLISLTCPKDSLSAGFFDMLPTTLETLDTSLVILPQHGPQTWAKLPSSVTSTGDIVFKGHVPTGFAGFPANLTHFVSPAREDVDLAFLRTLPPSFAHLSMLSLSATLSPAGPDDALWARELPLKLQTLEVSFPLALGTASIINSLPRTLTVLKGPIQVDWSLINGAIVNWPPALQIMDCRTLLVPVSYVHLLPCSLRALTICCWEQMGPADLSSLPKNLSYLSIQKPYREVGRSAHFLLRLKCALPSSITTLNLKGEHGFIGVPTQFLEFLPSSLTELRFQPAYGSSPLDGKKRTCYLPLTIKTLEMDAAHFAELRRLPPNLTSLKIDIWAHSSESADNWKHFPASLTKLEIGSRTLTTTQPLAPSQFRAMPKLRSFKFVSMRPVDMEVLRKLPTTLRTLVIQPANLTAETISLLLTFPRLAKLIFLPEMTKYLCTTLENNWPLTVRYPVTNSTPSKGRKFIEAKASKYPDPRVIIESSTF